MPVHILVFIISFFDGMLFGQRIGAIAFHYELSGLSASSIGLLQTVTALGVLPVSLFLAGILKKVPLKRLLIISALAGIFTDSWVFITDNYSFILFSRLISGTSASVIMIIAEVCMVSVLIGKKLEKAVVVQLSLFILGTGLGPSINALAFSLPDIAFFYNQPFGEFLSGSAAAVNISILLDIVILVFVVLLIRALPAIEKPQSPKGHYILWTIKLFPFEMIAFATIAFVEAAIVGLLPIALIRGGIAPDTALLFASCFFIGGATVLLVVKLLLNVGFNKRIAIGSCIISSLLFFITPLFILEQYALGFAVFIIQGTLIYYLNSFANLQIFTSLPTNKIIFATSAVATIFILSLTISPLIIGAILDAFKTSGYFIMLGVAMTVLTVSGLVIKTTKSVVSDPQSLQ